MKRIPRCCTWHTKVWTVLVFEVQMSPSEQPVKRSKGELIKLVTEHEIPEASSSVIAQLFSSVYQSQVLILNFFGNPERDGLKGKYFAKSCKFFQMAAGKKVKAEFSRPIQLTHQTWSDSQTLEDMRLYLSTPTSYHTNSSNGWSLRVKSAIFFVSWLVNSECSW